MMAMVSVIDGCAATASNMPSTAPDRISHRRGRWRGSSRPGQRQIAIMGTRGTLTAVTHDGRREAAATLLARAEAELRRIDALLSTWKADSELSRYNAAGKGLVPLSAETLRLLTVARDLHQETRSAFDVTCRPLVQLWRRAAEEGRAPQGAEARS